MSFPCKFCGTMLFPSTCGRMKLFEDDARTIFHDCFVLKNNYKLSSDQKLLARTITRVSQLEKQMSIMQKQLDIHMEDAV